MRAQHDVEGAEEHTNGALHSPCTWRLHLNTCVVQPRLVGTCARKARQDTAPTAGGARPWKAEKKQKTAPRGSVSLDKGSPHTCWAEMGRGVVSLFRPSRPLTACTAG